MNIRHLITLLFVLSTVAPLQAGAADFVESVKVVDKGENWELVVQFSTPVGYVKHFPRSRGKIVQLQIKLLDTTIPEKSIRKRETLLPKAGQETVFRDVIYEGNVRGGPYLVVRFPEVSDFIPDQSAKTQTMRIKVAKREKKADQEDVSPGSGQPDSALEQEMKQGKTALTRGEVVNAILIFSQLLAKPPHEFSQEAREFLGLARERNRQLELAKKEYETYLKMYGKTPRAKTVQQRLRSLEARMAAPKEQLKLGKRQKREKQGKKFRVDQFFGNWHQLVLTDAQKTSGVDNSFNASAVLVSILNLNKRVKEKDKEWRAVLQAQSQLDTEYPEKTTTTASDKVPKYLQVRAAYGEYRSKKNGWFGSFGRQSSKGAGVLQRFDGAVGSYSLNKYVNAKLVAGAPVEFSTFHTTQLLPVPSAGDFKPMFGVGLDLDNIVQDWKASLYYNQQFVTGIGSGLIDRMAVGGDLRYFKKNKTFFALLDYDMNFSALNFLTLHYGWRTSKRLRFDIHFDRRFSPVLFTSNALIGLANMDTSTPIGQILGQAAIDLVKENPTMSTLRENLIAKNKLPSEVNDLIRLAALENTARSTLGTLGMSLKLTKNLQWNNNMAVSFYNAGAAAEEADPDIDASFLGDGFNGSLSSQLIWRNFAQKNDMLMGGAQYSQNTSNTRYSVYGIYRGKLKDKWNADGRLRTTYSNNDGAAKQDEISMIPSLKIEYRWRKKVTFELEGGLDYTSIFSQPDTVRPFVNGGYRILF